MELTGLTICNRYTLTKKIHQGIFSDCYEAVRSGDANRLFLVRIVNDSRYISEDEDNIRIRHDLEIISSLNHPNIIKIHEFGEIFKLPFIIMDFVPGTSLFPFMKEKDITIQEIVDIIIQLCRALEELHRNGIIHRGLNPERIHVAGDPKSPNPLIMLKDIYSPDTKELVAPDSSTEEIPDYFEYYSPEQLSPGNNPVDQRSDLYSLGILFYRLATGRHPYSSDQILISMRSGIIHQPERSSPVNSSIDPTLGSIIMKLTSIERDSRYSSASSLLFDLQRYRSGDRNFPLEMTLHGLRADYHADFTGRGVEYKKLEELYNTLRKGQGHICIINGESGIGKTRLINEFIRYVSTDNALILSAGCSDDPQKEPYGLIKEFLNLYIMVFNNYPDKKKNFIRKSLIKSLGALGNIIIKLNCRMTDVIGHFPEPVRIDPEQENNRFVHTITDFFIQLSSIEKNLILAAEDLQRIDDDSLDLLLNILRNIGSTPILFVGSCNEESFHDSNRFLKLLRGIESCSEYLTRLNLTAFNRTGTSDILSSILHNSKRIIDDLTEFIHLKSSGNPLFTIEILKNLIDKGLIYYREQQWSYDRVKLLNAEIPATTSDFIIKKISNLDRDEAEVLSYASLTGHTFDIALLLRLLPSLRSDTLDSIIRKFISLNIIRHDAANIERFHFNHDSIRKILSSVLSPTEKKKIHFKIASALERIYEKSTDDIIYDLAFHYIESGNRTKALQYSYSAAIRASGTFANEEAIRFFNIVIDLINQCTEDQNAEYRQMRISSMEELVKIYLRTGRYDESISILNSIIPHIDDYAAFALSHNMISHAYFKKGEWNLCELYIKSGVEELGEKFPVKKSQIIISLIKELIIHLKNVLFPFFKTTNRSSVSDKKTELKIILYETLNYMYSIASPLKYLRMTLRILNIVEKYSRNDDIAVKALYLYGSLLSNMRFFRYAYQYLDRALTLALKINDPYLIGMSCYYLGTCLEWQGDYNGAVEKHHEAENYFRRIGNTTGIGFVLNGLCNCYLHLAEFDKLLTTADKNYNISISTKNYPLMCNALIYISGYYIRTGDFDMAMINARKAHQKSTELGVLTTLCVSCYYIGMIYHYKNELPQSLEYFEKAIDIYKKHRFIKHYTLAVYPLYTEALITLYSSPVTAPEEKKILLSRIRRYTDISMRYSEKIPSVNKYSLMASAKYHAITGNRTKADQTFRKCIKLTTDHGMKFDLARSLYEYGVFLGSSGFKEKAKRELELAYHIFSGLNALYYTEMLKTILGVKISGSNTSKIRQIVYKKKLELIDRLSSEIGQTADIENIFNQIINSASAIAGVHGGAMFLKDNRDNIILSATSGIFYSTFSDSINHVRETLDSGKTLMIEHENDSILYIPVLFKGKVVSACALFASPEERLTENESVTLITLFFNKISWILHYISDQTHNSRNDEWKLKISSTNEEKIKKVIEYIEENYMFDISREGLSALIDSNPDYFSKCFKLYTGMKINEYIHKIRIEEAAKRLIETEFKIIDIALSVGFDNLSTFNKAFQKTMNIIPSKYRIRKIQMKTGM